MTASSNPTTSTAIAIAFIVLDRIGVARMWRRPAATSTRNRDGIASGRGSAVRIDHRQAAATTKVTASTTATAPPPSAAYSPAPASGPTRRSPCLTVWMRPLADASSRAGITPCSSAARPGAMNANETP